MYPCACRMLRERERETMRVCIKSYVDNIPPTKAIKTPNTESSPQDQSQLKSLCYSTPHSKRSSLTLASRESFMRLQCLRPRVSEVAATDGGGLQ